MRKPANIKNSGFTLIELLVVISIIALLSSIVIASLQTARAKARYAQIVSQMRQIDIAAELYLSQTGSYPPDAGIGLMPGPLAPYLPTWPTPPCPNYVYDWDNFTGGTNINIDLRTVTPSASLNFYCVYNASGTACGTSGSDILQMPSKQFSC